MQQIAEWLEKLGMPEYIQRFTDNDIDFTILSDLTDQDLEKIGIASLGHRRKLLRAIAALETIEKSTPAVDAVVAPAASLPLDTAERRQVTVMFSDLVGSTALSARMDPEDLREVIAAYHKCVAAIVRRFDGFVAQYLGDGVLVYFGYPTAHEDDAERAVRAGIELIAAVEALKTRVLLQTRVGIATGLVVVGDLLEAGRHTSAALLAKLQISLRVCKGLPSRIRWSSRSLPEDFSAIFSSFRTLGRGNSKVWPGWQGPGQPCGQARWKAASRRYTRRACPPLSAATRKSSCCAPLEAGEEAKGEQC